MAISWTSTWTTAGYYEATTAAAWHDNHYYDYYNTYRPDVLETWRKSHFDKMKDYKAKPSIFRRIYESFKTAWASI